MPSVIALCSYPNTVCMCAAWEDAGIATSHFNICVVNRLDFPVSDARELPSDVDLFIILKPGYIEFGVEIYTRR